jgi:hypothetical protein
MNSEFNINSEDDVNFCQLNNIISKDSENYKIA